MVNIPAFTSWKIIEHKILRSLLLLCLNILPFITIYASPFYQCYGDFVFFYDFIFLDFLHFTNNFSFCVPFYPLDLAYGEYDI